MSVNRRQFLTGLGAAAFVPPARASDVPGARSLRITGVETFVVKNPPPTRGGKFWVFLKLLTDRGIIGYGEVNLQGSKYDSPPTVVE